MSRIVPMPEARPADDYASVQEGVYFRSGAQPGAAYRLLLLSIKDNVAPSDVREALGSIWDVLRSLKAGRVAELAKTRDTDPEVIDDKSGELTGLLGFGAPLFKKLKMEGPPDVELLRADGPFPSMRWAPDREHTVEAADIALQLIGATELAVERAVVDTWLQLGAKSPLKIVALYRGFNRPDGRGWLGFREGLNNIRADRRGAAIMVDGKTPPWMRGGTYMAFLRLDLNLSQWRDLPREHQEIIVGRDKLSGCPIERVDAGLVPVISGGGCPATLLRAKLSAPEVEPFLNPSPPPPGEKLLRASHINRANPNREGTVNEGDNRIFRQGYEFVELLSDGRLRTGVNFISFQKNARNFSAYTKGSCNDS